MLPEDQTLQNAKASMKAVYQRHAELWHTQRSRALYEKPWLDRFIEVLSPNGRVLDLGCGTGDPIAGYFLDQGFDIVGIDYAASMIEIASAQFPKAQWQIGDIRTLPQIETFDGIYSWDSFFHLSIPEQRAILPQLSKLIRQDGALLLTVGPREGEVTGTIGGEAVYHASLSPSEYEQTLKACGFQSVTYKSEDPDCQGRSVLFASAMFPDRNC